MIDIDYFKQYNDLNGHIAGDVALREMAAILRASVKRQDVVARYGGEEFAVVMFDTDRAAAHKVAERLRQGVEDVDFPNEQVLPGGHLTVSVGLAVFPEDAADRAELIAGADTALYSAKRSGRNRVCVQPGGECCDQHPAGHIAAAELGAFWRPKGGKPRRVTVRDISPRGALISLDRPPKAGQVIELILTGDFPGRRIEVPARVAWVQKVTGVAGAAGLEFMPPDAEVKAQLAKLVSDRDHPAAKRR